MGEGRAGPLGWSIWKSSGVTHTYSKNIFWAPLMSLNSHWLRLLSPENTDERHFLLPSCSLCREEDVKLERVHRKNEHPESSARSLTHTRLILKPSWVGFLLGMSLLKSLHYIKKKKKGQHQIIKDLLCCHRRVPQTPLLPEGSVRCHRVQKGQKEWEMKSYSFFLPRFSFASSFTVPPYLSCNIKRL